MKYLPLELGYASVLMPFYEFQFGEILARYPQYLSSPSRCNRRTVTRPSRLACPKCAFVFPMLSAFLDGR